MQYLRIALFIYWLMFPVLLLAQSKDSSVELIISLTNQQNEVVTNLRPSDIEIYQDGIPQKILSLHKEEGPVSVGILLDVSRSQRKHFPAVLDAIRVFIENSAPSDEYFVASFGEQINLLSDFAEAKATLDKLSAPTFENRSKVYDAIHYGLEKLQGGRHMRKALLVISDGQEDGSRVSYRSLLKSIKQKGPQIYCLGVGNTNSYDSVGPGDYWLGHLFLEEIATITGGIAFMKDKPDQLRKEAQLIAQQLWHQVSIEYQPAPETNPRRWRKIKVKTTAEYKNLEVHTRTYYSF